MQKISTHLWFSGQTGDAANFCASILRNFRIGRSDLAALKKACAGDYRS